MALDGTYRLTPSGRRFLAASNRGDLGAAKDALSLGQDRNTKLGERRDAAEKRKADIAQRKADREAKLAAKRAAKKSGSGSGSKKKTNDTPALSDEEQSAAATAKTQATAKATADKVSLSPDLLADMSDLADGISTQAKFPTHLAALGFADEDGLTPVGQRALKALESGNVRAYTALADQVQRNARAAADKAATVTTKSHIVIKQAKNGTWRWVMTSTTAYQDQDRETVTKAAIREDVAHADKTGNYGPLLWWHTKYRLGTCDFNMVAGPTLIESGTFRNGFIAKAVAKAANGLGVSIGFLPLPWEQLGPVYNFIRRKERSILPLKYASNLFTRLTVIKEKTRMDEETQLKIKQLAAMLEIPEAEALQLVEKEVNRVRTQAAAAGLIEKAANPFPPKKDDSADPMVKKADDNAAEDAIDGGVDDDIEAGLEDDGTGGTDLEEDSGSLFQPEELAEIATAIGPVVAQQVIAQLGPILDMEGRIMKLIDSLKGVALPTPSVPAPTDGPPPMVRKEVDDKFTALELKLKEANDKIAELSGDQPAGAFHRPSWGGDSIMGSALSQLVTMREKAAGRSNNTDPLDDIVDAILPNSKATTAG
jgi:hypothetical protein